MSFFVVDFPLANKELLYVKVLFNSLCHPLNARDVGGDNFSAGKRHTWDKKQCKFQNGFIDTISTCRCLGLNLLAIISERCLPSIPTNHTCIHNSPLEITVSIPKFTQFLFEINGLSRTPNVLLHADSHFKGSVLLFFRAQGVYSQGLPPPIVNRQLCAWGEMGNCCPGSRASLPKASLLQLLSPSRHTIMGLRRDDFVAVLQLVVEMAERLNEGITGLLYTTGLLRSP